MYVSFCFLFNDPYLEDFKVLVSFMVRAYRVSSSSMNAVKVTTVASQPPRRHNAFRLPLVEHGFSGWPVPQSYIHDCDVIYARTRYHIFFQRHRNLAIHRSLSFHGELIIMRVGKRNVGNVVNMQAGDRKRSVNIARR